MVKLLATVIIIASFMWPTLAEAAPATGLTISPPSQDLTIAAGQESTSFTIRVSNSTSGNVPISLSVVDFGGLDKSGGSLINGLNPDNFDRDHGLAEWVSLDSDSMEVMSGQSVLVTGHIINNQALTPGGHYGAIVATVEADSQSGQVGVTQSLASLLFVKKEGGEVYGISLAKLDASSAWWGNISTTSTEFKNNGNVHAVPRGIVQVIDPLNRVIGKGVINSESSIVLPDQIREIKVPMVQLGLPLWPGMYKVASQYRYQGSSQLFTKSEVVWQTGLVAPVVVFILLLATIWWSGRNWRRRMHS